MDMNELFARALKTDPDIMFREDSWMQVSNRSVKISK